jgi:putative ABC transport system permease protein
MIGKHLVLTLRSLKKNLLYAVLVITGLAIGITTFLSTIQWSDWHLNFDREFSQNESIHRLTFEENYDGFYRHTARILHGDVLNKIIFSDVLSGIDLSGRLAPFRKAALKFEDNTFYEQHAFSCDPSFLQIFDAKVIQGAKEKLLSVPFTAILTESSAKKFYGSTDPVGRTFDLMHQFDVNSSTYTVVAVIEDFPENSHFKISVLTSFEDAIDYKGTGWAYVKLNQSADPDEI